MYTSTIRVSLPMVPAYPSPTNRWIVTPQEPLQTKARDALDVTSAICYSTWTGLYGSTEYGSTRSPIRYVSLGNTHLFSMSVAVSGG